MLGAGIVNQVLSSKTVAFKDVFLKPCRIWFVLFSCLGLFWFCFFFLILHYSTPVWFCCTVLRLSADIFLQPFFIPLPL